MSPRTGVEANPFVRYRRHLDTYNDAVAAGVDDATYVRLVDELDSALVASGAPGFRVTPTVELEIGGGTRTMAKVETGNVAGSHKARHLFGLLLRERLAAAVGRPPTGRRWGIASCGNAALAAAVLAHGTGHPLDVFVPADADPVVLARLEDLGANVVTCRRPSGSTGDPCMAALDEALRGDTVPFTVQGTICPAVFDGGRTVGLELADQLEAVTDLYIQVGGGAFAVAVMDGWLRARDVVGLPRLHPVQPETAHPFIAAWHRLVPRCFTAIGSADPGDPVGRGLRLREAYRSGRLDATLAEAFVDDSGIMSPWPTTPRSVASGILDDVTYDWRPLVEHVLRSGGWPVAPSEDVLEEARELAAGQVTPPPDATGAAGLAGALADTHRPPGEGPIAVVLSGIDRSWEQRHDAP